MKKKWPLLLVGCLLLAGILGCILVMRFPHTSTVEILQDGKLLYQRDLSQAENQIIEVEYDGRVNTIQIQDGRIRMLEADCPDHICIQMGWLDTAAPIVCLPNHLIVQFSEENASIDIVV